MRQISKEEFETSFEKLEEVYNHSGQIEKWWQKSVNKYYVVDNYEEEIRKYWKYNKR